MDDRGQSQAVASRSVSDAVDAMFEALTDATETAREFLASEQGRRLRQRLATAVMISAPFLSELPAVRRSPLARLMRTAAVGALLVKGAEWLRDWDPGPSSYVEQR
ncbi:hypothetical protein BH20ACT24_BH20ACT24_20350 [soil metagenome]|nr:hypothetical protein [Actinomycetota bacterium]